MTQRASSALPRYLGTEVHGCAVVWTRSSQGARYVPSSDPRKIPPPSQPEAAHPARQVRSGLLSGESWAPCSDCRPKLNNRLPRATLSLAGDCFRNDAPTSPRKPRRPNSLPRAPTSLVRILTRTRAICRSARHDNRQPQHPAIVVGTKLIRCRSARTDCRRSGMIFLVGFSQRCS